jgi:hypothetical protein
MTDWFFQGRSNRMGPRISRGPTWLWDDNFPNSYPPILLSKFLNIRELITRIFMNLDFLEPAFDNGRLFWSNHDSAAGELEAPLWWWIFIFGAAAN